MADGIINFRVGNLNRYHFHTGDRSSPGPRPGYSIVIVVIVVVVVVDSIFSFYPFFPTCKNDQSITLFEERD